MNLIYAMMEDFKMMEKQRVPDGEGGATTVWAEGLTFQAVATLDTTMQARIAEKQGVSSTFTITTRSSVRLDFHDVVKRVSDGKIFRVTSDGGDKVSPSVASFDVSQVNAEKWELTS